MFEMRLLLKCVCKYEFAQHLGWSRRMNKQRKHIFFMQILQNLLHSKLLFTLTTNCARNSLLIQRFRRTHFHKIFTHFKEV